jgi:hypothetical protein
MLNSFKWMMPLFKGIHDGQMFFVNKGKLMKVKANKMKKVVLFWVVKVQRLLQS